MKLFFVSREKYRLKDTTEFIEEMKFENDNMVLIDRGRTVNERSAVLIENGIYKGYCFYDLNYQVNNIEILKNIIIPMQSNRDTRNNIQAYLRKNKYLKIYFHYIYK